MNQESPCVHAGECQPNVLAWIERVKQLPGYLPRVGI